jgi:deoxyribose-phosphate aldolase
MNRELLIEEITKQVLAHFSENKASDTQKEHFGEVIAASPALSSNAPIITAAQVARMIDHTLLKPESTQEQVIQLCEQAKEHQFASVCINPCWVPVAAKALNGSGVAVCTVIGFPLGATSTYAKIAEARDAIASGATEIDMVMNIGAMKSGLYDMVKRDIEAVVQACQGQAIVKVIIETGHLNEEEKKKACLLAKMAGADFVKTSTGFGPGCATAKDVQLMRDTVGPDMGVKASACVRDLDTARQMIQAGANRLGTSSGLAILEGRTGKGY